MHDVPAAARAIIAASAVRDLLQVRADHYDALEAIADGSLVAVDRDALMFAITALAMARDEGWMAGRIDRHIDILRAARDAP